MSLADRVLADRILAEPARLGPVRLVAIDGPTGAGKTTVAGRLAAEFALRSVTTFVLPTDHFATWADPVSWWPRLNDGVLQPLKSGRSGRYQRTDWRDGIPHPGDWITVDVPEVLVIEGVSAGRRSVQPLLTCLVWVDGDDQQTRLERSVARDGEASRDDLRRWQRFESGWFPIDGTRDRAVVRVRS